MERVAELVGLARLLPLAATTGAIEPMAAECVRAQPAEEVVEHLLPDASAATRGQFHAIAVSLEVARTLELLREIVEGVEVACRILAQQPADLLAVDAAEIAGVLNAVELRLERVERLEVGHLLQGAVKAESLVAAEPEPLAQAAGHQLVQRCRELRKVPPQAVVAQEGIHHSLQLGALSGAHGLEERLHGGHAVGELLDDVVEGPGAGKELTVLREECADVGVAARPVAPPAAG